MLTSSLTLQRSRRRLYAQEEGSILHDAQDEGFVLHNAQEGRIHSARVPNTSSMF